jgi:hypothetical protein
MIKRAFLLAILAVTGAFRPALAECGDPATGPALINMADLVFEGTAVKTEPELLGRFSGRFYNYATEYKIGRLYKGPVSDSATVKIYYRFDEGVEDTIAPVELNADQLVFARLDAKGRFYFTPCARNYMRMDLLEKNGPNQGTRDALMTLENRSERVEKILRVHRNLDRED